MVYDIIQLVDEPFLERLSIVLDDCVQQYTLTQEEKEELGWTRTSFHYRIALIIASSLSQKCPSLLLDKFEVLMLEVEESLESFKDDVMIYQSSVFVFLFRHDIFPRYVPLVEMWMEQDEESCRWFYTNGKFDDELNTAVNNSLIVRTYIKLLITSLIIIN
ncbi:unnamed protein product [Orchesella dallaii]|uniref:Uncharacterized protein n=1 Tax=Orchesella dallaii TaxID=48710 RepID=A0ABP1R8K8_9HEXA